MRQLLPAWLRDYQRTHLGGDLGAGFIVALLLIPQSLAYALLAGVPLEMGLYASLLPLAVYALLGSSMTLSVGPVAVTALMTASALTPLAAPGSPAYAALAIELALWSGAFLLLFGLLRLGFLAHFLSHPVIGGFGSGAAILIVLSQLKPLLGLPAAGSDMLAPLRSLPALDPLTATLGGTTLVLLLLARRLLPETLARLVPLLLLFAMTTLNSLMAWPLAQVGTLPEPLPQLQLPGFGHVHSLWLPALLLALVGFAESMAVARRFARERHEKIQPNRELIALGAANLASAASGGIAVTGGLSRSIVNFSAGAHTPLASLIAAVVMALCLLFAAPLLAALPHTVLAAIIIAAVLHLVRLDELRQAWRYDKADALAWLTAFGSVLVLGIEAGLLAGVVFSLGVLVWRSSHPHMAIVGRVPGSEHFRNVQRHQVDTLPGVLMVRVDESLYFANAAAVQEKLETLVRAEPALHHLVLLCPAVNQIDSTALQMLVELDHSLARSGVQLLLAEIKGPVMDRLHTLPEGNTLACRTYLSAHAAWQTLSASA